MFIKLAPQMKSAANVISSPNKCLLDFSCRKYFSCRRCYDNIFCVAEKELIQYSDVKFTTYFLDIFLVTGKYISVMKYTMENIFYRNFNIVNGNDGNQMMIRCKKNQKTQTFFLRISTLQFYFPLSKMHYEVLHHDTMIPSTRPNSDHFSAPQL